VKRQVSQTNPWKVVREFEIVYGIGLGQRLSEQLAQFRNVPGAVVQCEELVMERLPWSYFE
jgi:hypothetical protein